jgi:ribonucleoside-diphosphate reductase alpha chain
MPTVQDLSSFYDRIAANRPYPSPEQPVMGSAWREGLALSENALFLLEQRFLRRSESGELLETPDGMFRRVARAIAKVEATPEGRQLWERHFYEVMAALEFHPGSRVLANAGTAHPQLANCFVFPLADTQQAILETFTESSIIKGYGGGCGFNYSAIRPSGDVVRGVPGLAVGPVRLLQIFNLSTTMFRQQGRYESGNMAVLNADHPDLFEFIAAKTVDGSLSLTNISIGAPDTFMSAVEEDRAWDLVNPRTRALVRTVSARSIFEAACQHAWETGDPGLLFLDRINRDNPLREHLGDIQATNTCGEIGLYPYESCNLGYLNLTRFLLPEGRRTSAGIFDEKKLNTVVAVAVRMIDNAISASWFPLEKIRDTVQANRRVGLGVTGWADCLAMSDIPYDSEEALELAESLSRSLYQYAFEASTALGCEKGPFSNVGKSIWREVESPPRNVAVLAFPPSGNNAVIFDTSFGIEPLFALVFHQNILGGMRIKQLNRPLLRSLERAGVSSDGLFEIIEAERGSLQGLAWIPDSIKRVFKTAHDIEPEWQVRMQAAFQRHTDNAVAKTVNLFGAATPDDVARLFLLAWKQGCKGITVYRDRSREGQTIEFGAAAESAPAPDCGPVCPACQG